MLIRQARVVVSLGVLLVISSCSNAGIGIDQKLAADLSYIKIVRQAPSPKCRYLGESLSFYMKIAVGTVNGENARKVQLEFELRMKAKELGANVIDTRLDANTGYDYQVLVHTFHAC
jgi:hypothetical protein